MTKKQLLEMIELNQQNAKQELIKGVMYCSNPMKRIESFENYILDKVLVDLQIYFAIQDISKHLTEDDFDNMVKWKMDAGLTEKQCLDRLVNLVNQREERSK